MSKTVTIMYAVLFSVYLLPVFVMFGINVDQLKQTKKAKYLIKYVYLFYTNWNYVAQMIFALLRIGELNILNIWPEKVQCQKNLGLFRKYLYTAIMAPNTIFIMLVFWGVYALNREWIYPKELDAFVPTYVNHLLHTAIILPIVIETYFCDSDDIELNIFYIRRALLACELCFYLGMYYVYFIEGLWLYGMFEAARGIRKAVLIVFLHYLLIHCQKITFMLQCVNELRSIK